MNLTPSEKKVIEKIRSANKSGENKVYVKGVRETKAAKKVVEIMNSKGINMKYTQSADWVGGGYYVDPFTKQAKTTKKTVVIGGLIEWENKI